MRLFLSAIALCVLPSLGAAQVFEAQNRLLVVPLKGDRFEVIEARGEGPRGIWCAAADYAADRLGMSRSTRVYILRGRGPSVGAAGRKSVVFTTNPAILPQGPSQSVSLSTSQVGVGLPVNHARQFCRDYILDLLDALSP